MFTVLFLEGIDLLTGASGWALTFVFPSAILAMVLATIILMIVNIRNWQSYMMMQLFSCADERDCDDTCGSQGHMVPISGNGSDGRIAVFVSRNTDYR